MHELDIKARTLRHLPWPSTQATACPSALPLRASTKVATCVATTAVVEAEEAPVVAVEGATPVVLVAVGGAFEVDVAVAEVVRLLCTPPICAARPRLYLGWNMRTSLCMSCTVRCDSRSFGFA